MLKVLITGGTGFIASHFLDLVLREHKEKVVLAATKRWRSPLDNVQHLPESAVKWYDVDLTDAKAVEEVIVATSPDVVVHAAAQSYVDFSFANPKPTYAANFDGTDNVLAACQKLQQLQLQYDESFVRVVLVTSSEVYGRVQPEDVPITEECQFRPASPYGISKAAADLLGGFYRAAYGLDVVRLRNFTTSGPRRGPVFFDSSWCRQVARIEKGRQAPVVQVGNLASIRTVMDVRDLVRAYWLLATEREWLPAGEAYNVAGNETFEIGHVLELLRGMSKVEWEVREDRKLLRPCDVTDQRPSSAKFRAATGWRPEIPYEQTLEEMLAWWRVRV